MDDLFGFIEQPKNTPQAVDHRCLACGETHAGARLVTLHDGRQVSSYSEEWRLECEATRILVTPLLERRQSILRDIEKRRGEPAAKTLRARMLAIQSARRANKNETA